MTTVKRTTRTKPIARRPGGRSARVRRAVFDATLRLLAINRYKAPTIEAVAAAARVNKTTVYRNWPTRAALIAAAAKDRSEAVIITESTGDPARDLTAFLRSIRDHITSPLGWALVVATLNETEDAEARRARDEFWQHRFEAAAGLVRAATAGRVSRRADVGTFVESLIGPLFLRVFVTGSPVDDSFIRDTVRRALRRVS